MELGILGALSYMGNNFSNIEQEKSDSNHIAEKISSNKFSLP